MKVHLSGDIVHLIVENDDEDKRAILIALQQHRGISVSLYGRHITYRLMGDREHLRHALCVFLGIKRGGFIFNSIMEKVRS